MTQGAIEKTISLPGAPTAGVDKEVKDAVLDILLGTNAHTGDCYLRGITETVATYFGVNCAYLCEFTLDFEKAYPIASYADMKATPRIDFFLRGGACEDVIEHGDIVHSQAVVRHFPDDSELRALQAEAVVGTVLRSESGDPIGALLLVHRQPLPQAAMIDAVLQMLAPRISAELERRQHELAIRRSETRLRLLTDRSKDVLFYYQLKPNVEVQYVSPAVESVFGMPAEAFHANPELVFSMLDSDDRDSFEKAISSGSEEPLVAKIRLPDGSSRWVEYRDFAVKDQQSRLAGIGGTVRDITRRVEAEESLKNSERYLRGLLECIPDTLLLLRSDGEVLDYVPGEVNTGLPSPEQTRGRNLKELMSPAMVGVLDRAVRAAARSHRVQRVEFEVPGDSPRFFDARCLPFGDALLLVLRDLTAQRWHEGEERRQRIRDEVDDRIENRTKANPYGLTYRELAVLHLVVEGMADKQIADALGISIYTVNKHVGNVLGKMNAASRTEAGVRAVKEGLLPRD